MKPLTIHIEGGQYKGNQVSLSEMRASFRLFLDVNSSVKISLWGNRQQAYEEFKKALDKEQDREHLLLVDSEAPLKENKSRWLHVRDRQEDQWIKPKDATDEHLHFMAQCVEAWLVADPDALDEYYGKKLKNLPQNNNVEDIPKNELAEKLKAATKDMTKREYHKTRHFPAILKLTDRETVAKRAEHLRILLKRLRDSGYAS